MTFSLLIPIVGCLIVEQSARRTCAEFSLDASTSVKVRTGVMILTLIIDFLMGDCRFLSWLMIGGFAVGLRTPIFFAAQVTENRLMTHLPDLLEEIWMGMHSGQTFRRALHEISCRQTTLWLRRLTADFFNRLESSAGEKGLQGLSREVMVEFVAIDRALSRSADQVKALRRFYRIRADFRRKSGIVTTQTRLQSLLAIALFLPLLILNIKAGSQTGRLLVAGGLFLAAQVWIQTGFRGQKWKT